LIHMDHGVGPLCTLPSTMRNNTLLKGRGRRTISKHWDKTGSMAMKEGKRVSLDTHTVELLTSQLSKTVDGYGWTYAMKRSSAGGSCLNNIMVQAPTNGRQSESRLKSA